MTGKPADVVQVPGRILARRVEHISTGNAKVTHVFGSMLVDLSHRRYM